MITSESATLVCESQFETARSIDKSYMHALCASDYYFGSIGHSGLDVARLIRGIDDPTVLDIGAGYGTFLRELLAAESKKIKIERAIGFTAVPSYRTIDNEGIEWVFGDFQRPDTWNPSDVIQPHSVDLAVSSLTFQHFAHPLAALESAFNVLRIGGHLLIDRMEVLADPSNIELVNEIMGGLRPNLGEWAHKIDIDRASAYLDLRFLHLIKRIDDPLFPNIEAVAEEGSRQVTYKLAE